MRHIFHLNAVTLTSEPLPRLVVADFVKAGKLPLHVWNGKWKNSAVMSLSFVIILLKFMFTVSLGFCYCCCFFQPN